MAAAEVRRHALFWAAEGRPSPFLVSISAFLRHCGSRTDHFQGQFFQPFSTVARTTLPKALSLTKDEASLAENAKVVGFLMPCCECQEAYFTNHLGELQVRWCQKRLLKKLTWRKEFSFSNFALILRI